MATRNPGQSSWWSTASILNGTDDINEAIWQDSPAIHTRPRFTTNELSEPGSLGAQQVMLDASISPELGMPLPVLPWVPDLLGTDWTHEDGIIIVGQNYGQFITRYTDRPKRMSAQAYASATTWQDFHAAFIPDVVINDNDYYEPLAPLLNTTNARDRFVITDLVRCTLVQRAETSHGATTRIDNKINLRDPKHQEVYAKYADLTESKDWLWDRITGTKARTIIGLGRAPYCGLLRLFTEHHCTITDHKSATPWRYKGSQWMYNCGINSIEGRLASGDRHDVNSIALQRSWTVILVAHPTKENHEYKAAVALINAARDSNGC